MKIYYQGEKGAYSYIAAKKAAIILGLDDSQLEVSESFTKVRESIDARNIGILPIENSYAGSIHENMYSFLRFDHKVIGEIHFPIRHCLLSKEKDISDIRKVYSHPQALSQCHDYLHSHQMEGIDHINTAVSAKMVSESHETGIAAIASEEAGRLFCLNILEEDIQDQDGNTTRFFVVARKDSDVEFSEKKNKTTLVFDTRNIPASLYKCLGAFATNSINLSKIESMPNLKDPFSYLFWLDLEGTLDDKRVQNALKELEFFTRGYHIIGQY